MNLIDVVLIVMTIGYGLAGLSQGFVAGAAATVGLLTGGAIGIVVMPRFLDRLDPSVGVSALALVSVLVLASVGQAFGAFMGHRLRQRITWRPARSLDAIGGAALSMAAVLGVAWALGYAISGARLPAIADPVRSSAVLSRIDAVMPSQADAVLAAFARIVDTTLFPRYLEPFAPERIAPIDAPNARILQRPGVVAAQRSVVKVIGEAAECGRTQEGSGFVYAPGRVMTNAHVVAGVTDPVVVVGEETFNAETVVYDADLDVAILAIDAPAPALGFDTSAGSGDPAAVLGFPENGPYDASPARVRAEQRLRSPDIYDEGAVTREVLSIRALVRSGNSGGPLVSAAGDVYGVVFAASLNDSSTGYVLTAEQVAADARTGRTAAAEVSTGGCT